MIRNIVVGYDASRSSEVAAQQAMSLAEATNARIRLTTILAVTDGGIEDAMPSQGLDVVEAALPPAQAPDEEEDEQVLAPPGVDAIRSACQDRDLVCRHETLFDPSAGARLLECSSLADLLLIGRSSERVEGAPALLGPTAQYVAGHVAAPTFICARQYLETRSMLMPYDLTISAGRALGFAAKVCEQINAKLDVVVCDRDRHAAGGALKEVQDMLRAYDVEGVHSISLGPPAEAIGVAALESEVSVIVVPGAERRSGWLPWGRNEALWRAFEVPNAAVLAYP